MREATRLIGAALTLVLGACSSSAPTAPTPAPTPMFAGPPVRVLMLTATYGFRHDSIATARDTMPALGQRTGAFTIAATEDLSAVNAANLANFDVLMFACTSGELPFTGDQRAALLTFVHGGKGFVGIHSATDTLYDWPEYGGLVGAYFREHPWTQRATVIVEDQSHPAAGSAGPSFSIEEEFYTFRENPRPRVHVLFRLDASSVGAAGDYPLAWAHNPGSGRAYYNALGHFPSTWQDSRFQSQLVAAIRWTAFR